MCNVDSCENPVKTRGWCSKHYLRALKYGDPEKTVRFTADMTLLDRIVTRGWDELESGCWIWRGHKDHFNYPMIKFGGKQVRVHRAMWEIANGLEFPSGMNALHSCDNPPCMNPEHIRPGTQAENVEDAVSKGRQAKGPGSSLTASVVKDIRDRVAAGEMQKLLCSEYGIDSGTISKIVTRKIFKWVD